MQKLEVAERFNELLDSFVGLGKPHLGQKEYKDDCWKIFIETPTNITADQLRDSIEGLFDPKSEKYKSKLELLKQLHSMLHEWIYARKKLS